MFAVVLLTFGYSFLARITQADDAVHEWMGLIAYRLAGRTIELLPSPDPKNG
jgi:hypothetical protein